MLFLINEETSVAQTRERSQIPEKYIWDLTPIYPSDEAYLLAKDALVKKFDQILNYKGKLGQSADQLYAGLNLNSEISKEMARLGSYISFKADLIPAIRNISVCAGNSQLATEYYTKAVFIQPEILEIDPAKLKNSCLQRIEGLRVLYQ